MLLACGAYALFLAFASFDGGSLPRATAIKRLGAALVSVIVGLAIGAVQYLPFREYVAWSPRAGGLPDYQTATSYAWPPEELFNTYLPQFSGMLENYWGRNGIHFHSEYVGAVVLVLAGAAFIGLRKDPRRKEISLLVDHAARDGPLVAGKRNAVLSDSLRDRAGNEILSRAGHDLLRRHSRDCAAGVRRHREISAGQGDAAVFAGLAHRRVGGRAARIDRRADERRRDLCDDRGGRRGSREQRRR